MTWRVSSYSKTSNCAEAGEWRTGTASSHNGACAEAGQAPHGVAVRDTRDRGGPVLAFTPAAWRAFTRSVQGSPPRVLP